MNIGAGRRCCFLSLSGDVGAVFRPLPIAALSPGIAQPVLAVGSLKFVAMFMLFATALSTGNGINLLVAVVLIEIISGFSGLFSGFKTVFIILFLAALSLRMTLRPTNVLVGGVAVDASSASVCSGRR